MVSHCTQPSHQTPSHHLLRRAVWGPGLVTSPTLPAPHSPLCARAVTEALVCTTGPWDCSCLAAAFPSLPHAVPGHLCPWPTVVHSGVTTSEESPDLLQSKLNVFPAPQGPEFCTAFSILCHYKWGVHQPVSSRARLPVYSNS
jgi:hypothetical protein